MIYLSIIVSRVAGVCIVVFGSLSRDVWPELRFDLEGFGSFVPSGGVPL